MPHAMQHLNKACKSNTSSSMFLLARELVSEQPITRIQASKCRALSVSSSIWESQVVHYGPKARPDKQLRAVWWCSDIGSDRRHAR
jgi:hypothetical protein